jgi:hypothetical protein
MMAMLAISLGLMVLEEEVKMVVANTRQVLNKE